jgi:LysR family transcriptional regulator for metE and metH
VDTPNRIRSQIIDSRQIAAFDALVHSRSFTVAAERLCLTQSAVSHAIKSLEQELDCQLFERRGRTIILTPAGERLYKHTTSILREMRASRDELAGRMRGRSGEMAVGMGPLACQYVLPQVLDEFKGSDPDCVIRVQAGSQQKLFAALLAREIDLAVTLEGPVSNGLSLDPLWEVELRFFVSNRHRWVDLSSPPRWEVAQETFILPMQGHQTCQLLTAHLRAHGYAPKRVMVPGNVEAARQLVNAGIGVGVFAPWQVTDELAQGTLVEVKLTAEKLVRKLVTAHLQGHEFIPTELKFIDLCRAAFEALCASMV